MSDHLTTLPASTGPTHRSHTWSCPDRCPDAVAVPSRPARATARRHGSDRRGCTSEPRHGAAARPTECSTAIPWPFASRQRYVDQRGPNPVAAGIAQTRGVAPSSALYSASAWMPTVWPVSIPAQLGRHCCIASRAQRPPIAASNFLEPPVAHHLADPRRISCRVTGARQGARHSCIQQDDRRRPTGIGIGTASASAAAWTLCPDDMGVVWYRPAAR
jgi:hypothetical protein